MDNRRCVSTLKTINSRNYNHQLNISNQTKDQNLPMGLQNVGNTCFLNSIIQFLYSAEELRKSLIEKYQKLQSIEDAKFSKLLAKLFYYLKQKNTLNKKNIRNILQKMVYQLQLINTQYHRYLQQDALQTLLNILSQIESKHPELIQKFDVQYKSECRCCQFISKDRVLSLAKMQCIKCGQFISRRLISAPKYIIYSNSSKKDHPNQIQEVGEKQTYGYKCKAQIIYYGNGRWGHYLTRRLEQDGSEYQFNDQKVNLIQKSVYGAIKPNPLIMLYELEKSSPRQFRVEKTLQFGQHHKIFRKNNNRNQDKKEVETLNVESKNSTQHQKQQHAAKRQFNNYFKDKFQISKVTLCRKGQKFSQQLKEQKKFIIQKQKNTTSINTQDFNGLRFNEEKVKNYKFDMKRIQNSKQRARPI